MRTECFYCLVTLCFSIPCFDFDVVVKPSIYCLSTEPYKRPLSRFKFILRKGSRLAYWYLLTLFANNHRLCVVLIGVVLAVVWDLPCIEKRCRVASSIGKSASVLPRHCLQDFVAPSWRNFQCIISHFIFVRSVSCFHRFLSQIFKEAFAILLCLLIEIKWSFFFKSLFALSP